MQLFALPLLAVAILSADDPSPRARARLASALPVRGRAVAVSPIERGGSWQPQLVLIEGDFGASLYSTLDALVPDSILDRQERITMAWDVANVLRWDVDFTREPRVGADFAFVVERLISPVGQVRYGRLVAARLEIGKRIIEAYEFDSPDGRSLYYDAAGMSIERSFLSAPVEFRRISSGYARARLHPVLGTWRAHRGVDYVTEPGAPVLSVAEGMVMRAAWAGSYGRLVEIQHPNGAITRYAHLRDFPKGLKKGAHVRQGQTIGFVGASGLVTGPHLHFELLFAGRQVDPRRVNGGSGTPLADEDRPGFSVRVHRLRELLESGLPERSLARRT